jgi:hypothetical protein
MIIIPNISSSWRKILLFFFVIIFSYFFLLKSDALACCGTKVKTYDACGTHGCLASERAYYWDYTWPCDCSDASCGCPGPEYSCDCIPSEWKCEWSAGCPQPTPTPTPCPSVPSVVPLNPLDNATITGSSYNFSWRSVSGADRYALEIKRSTDPACHVDGGSDYCSFYDVHTITSLNTTVSGLTPGTYYWDILAHDACGNWSPRTVRTFYVAAPLIPCGSTGCTVSSPNTSPQNGCEAGLECWKPTSGSNICANPALADELLCSMKPTYTNCCTAACTPYTICTNCEPWCGPGTQSCQYGCDTTWEYYTQACNNGPCPTPTPTPTPGPGQCAAPSPNGNVLDCAPSGGNGPIRWEWNAVPGANRYEIDIYNSSDSIVINNPVVAAGGFYSSCAAGGGCAYVTSLPPGIYYARIQATGDTCTPSVWAQSGNATMSYCATPTPTPAPPTPTPPPGQCAAPAQGSPSVLCALSGGNGSVTWQWSAVSGANQYEIDIYDSGGSIVFNNLMRSASDFGCSGGGTCAYTTSHGTGTYYARTRAQGDSCTASSWAQSANATVNLCSVPTPSPTPAGPTPTPAPSQCSIPTPIDPTNTVCAPPSGGNGSITWNWDAVWDPDVPGGGGWVANYEIGIYNSSGTLVRGSNNGSWQPASTFGCAGGGVCSWTTNLPQGTYSSRIRANGYCYDSAWSTATYGTIDECDSCSLAFTQSSYSVDMGWSSLATLNSQKTGPSSWEVQFTTSPSGILSADSPRPGPPGNSTVTTTLHGDLPGTTTLTAHGVMTAGPSAGDELCSDDVQVSVRARPWWQVVDSDVTSGGDITSIIPPDTVCSEPSCKPYFGRSGGGGFAGVPLYANSFSYEYGAISDSGANWSAQSSYVIAKPYDFNYFKTKVPVTFGSSDHSEISSGSINNSYLTNSSYGASAQGYAWFHRSGSLSIDGNVDLGSRKVIILVEGGTLTINGRITLTQGSGFFMAIATGDISISCSVDHPNPNVPSITGILFTEGNLRTNSCTSQLWIKGAVAAYSGVLLNRNLYDANNTTPAEVFEYSPELIALFPKAFATTNLNWTEVAPSFETPAP